MVMCFIQEVRKVINSTNCIKQFPFKLDIKQALLNTHAKYKIDKFESFVTYIVEKTNQIIKYYFSVHEVEFECNATEQFFLKIIAKTK